MRRFLIVGQTGVGKSSFVNATFGTSIAKTDKFKACTQVIEHYVYHTNFGEIGLIDTPGLSEDSLETDKAYLHLLQQYITRTSVDITLYITKLNETRFRPDEQRTLKLLTDYLGPSIWQRAWIVYTFAASVPNHQLHMATTVRNDSITSYLRTLTAGSATPFSAFLKIIQIDNIVANWHNKATPISSVLTTILP